MSRCIQARVRPLDVALHEVEVQLSFPPGLLGEGGYVALPVWTPGSYMVRDHARFLDRLVLKDAGGACHFPEKVGTSRWRLPALEGEAVLEYRLFCNDLTVRTNHVDAHHGQLVGAATWLYLEGHQDLPWNVRFQRWPEAWRVASVLPEVEGAFHAPDYDTLVDSPFELGTFQRCCWEQRGVDFTCVITGDHPLEDGRIVSGLRDIIDACEAMLGPAPFPRYVFFLTFSPGGFGGLEHRDCTSLLLDPGRMSGVEGPYELFTLAAHEYLHAWNVKRLRAKELGPFDYQRENPTRLLWFHEGLTNFLQFVVVLKARLVPWTWVARRLAQWWTDQNSRAGRLEQALEASSFDAWIRFYRPTEFSTNSTVSYYDKGALVAWLMDAHLRLATAGRFGVAEYLAFLWQRHGDGPLEDQDLRAAFQELSGRNPEPFWAKHITGVGSLDAGPLEKAYGLRFDQLAPWDLLSEEERMDPLRVQRSRGWSGLTFGTGAPVVQNVLPSSPAAKAGLGYGAEILAVNDWRTTTAAEAQARLGEVLPGQTVRVLASLRGRVETFRLRITESRLRTTRIVPDPGTTQAQRAAFLALTGSPHPAPVALLGRRIP